MQRRAHFAFAPSSPRADGPDESPRRPGTRCRAATLFTVGLAFLAVSFAAGRYTSTFALKEHVEGVQRDAADALVPVDISVRTVTDAARAAAAPRFSLPDAPLPAVDSGAQRHLRAPPRTDAGPTTESAALPQLAPPPPRRHVEAPAAAAKPHHPSPAETAATPSFLEGPSPPSRPYHGLSGVSTACLVTDSKRREELEALVASGAALDVLLSPRAACDAELLINGAFSPLSGFMTHPVYSAVLRDSRLGNASGLGNVLWPIPITLELPSAVATALRACAHPRACPLALRDQFYNLVGVLFPEEDPWMVDVEDEATAVYGTTDTSHPGVAALRDSATLARVGGRLEGLRLPVGADGALGLAPALRSTPAELRTRLAALGWRRTVAFQTRNPMHRAHVELTVLAAREARAGVLLHPVIGPTKSGDLPASVRVRAIEALLDPPRGPWSPGGVTLALLPLAMRMAGPREALWHAIIRKNYGATHFIIGRDHAGCADARGVPFYEASAASSLVTRHADELGIVPMPYAELDYVPALRAFFPRDRRPPNTTALSLSGTAVRAALAAGAPLPDWFSDPAVIAVLRSHSPPLSARGVVVWLSGLSGSGKSTLALALASRLAAAAPSRRVTLLDGDVVRTHLSRGLGFSLGDRAANVERVGFVAAEAARHGGLVLATPISPSARARDAAASLVREAGGVFLSVHVAPPLRTVVARDVKGLYRKALGVARDASQPATLDLSRIKVDLTGVSHPFEAPLGAQDALTLELDTEALSVEECIAALVVTLHNSGLVALRGGANVTGGATALEAALIAATSADGGSAIEEDPDALPAAEKNPIVSPALLRAFDPVVARSSACTLSWGRFEVPTVGDVGVAESAPLEMWGGLPMRGSPTAVAVAAATLPGVGIFFGRAPAQVTFIAAPSDALLRVAVAEAGGIPVARFSTARVRASEVAGLREAALGVGITLNTPAPAPPTPFLAKGSADDSSLVDDAGDDVDASASSVASLYAAYDLWTSARWAPQWAPLALAAALGNGTGGSSPEVYGVAHERLVYFAPSLLRVDPCARAIFALPSTSADSTAEVDVGIAEYVRAARAVANSFPGRVSIVHAA